MILALLIIVSAFILNLFLPWWSIALAGLIFGFVFKEKALTSFLWGFTALFILWGSQAMYTHLANDGVLTGRIAEMLGVGSPLIVVLITGVIGGIVGGLSTLTGSLMNPKKTRLLSTRIP